MATVRILGNMKWFRVAEQPDSLDLLPPVFSEMKDLWSLDSLANSEKIAECLAPYVGGSFVAENLSDWDNFFSDASFGEFDASEVNVVGFDFSEQPIPSCKVEATFDIPLKEGVSVDDVIKWSEEELCGDLYSAVIFYWDLNEFEALEDLDLTVGDHGGCEAMIIT